MKTNTKENTMKIINLTPRTINELITNQSFPPSGIIARLDSSTAQVNEINKIPLYEKLWGTIKNLPDSVEGTVYVVPGVMLDAGVSQGRTDLVAPGELVRNNGKIIGCKGFSV